MYFINILFRQYYLRLKLPDNLEIYRKNKYWNYSFVRRPSTAP